MDICDRRAIRQEADSVLSRAGQMPGKLVLLHTGVTLGVSLLLTVINYILTRQIDTTGGLSGMGTRSVLTTARSVLELAAAFVMPFWQIGFLKCAMAIVRGQQSQPGDLLEGLRRFGPVLRLKLLKGLIFGGIGIACMYLSSTVLMFTPFSQPLFDAIEPLAAQEMSYEEAMAAADTITAAAEQVALPLMAIFAVIFGVIAAPLAYRLRMADYVILDTPGTGALAALGASGRMMRRRRFQLFRLDLSLWWFYALELITGAVCYGDVLLKMAGVSLPIDSDTAFFLFFLIHTVCQLALYWWAKARVETAYAVCYEGMKETAVLPEPASNPGSWDYPA